MLDKIICRKIFNIIADFKLKERMNTSIETTKEFVFFGLVVVVVVSSSITIVIVTSRLP